MELITGEIVIGCVAHDYAEKEDGQCSECSQITYKTLIVTAHWGYTRRIPLCGQHFVEAVSSYPEIQTVENSTIH